MSVPIAALRRATHDIHSRLHLHPAFAPLTAALPDAAGYVRLLGQLRGFHAPVEAWLFPAAERLLPELSDLAQRRKAHLLDADLAVFATGANVRGPMDDVPEDTLSRPVILGCLYVIEGATLGGRELGRRLDPVLRPLGLAEPQGRRFLFAYGTRQGAMWRDFCSVLTQVAAGFAAAEHALMENAAIGMFLRMERWLTVSSQWSLHASKTWPVGL